MSVTVPRDSYRLVQTPQVFPAQMLKEADFDLPCNGIYHVTKQGEYNLCIYDRKFDLMELSYDERDGFQYEYLAPTQSLAAKWLREAHGICIILTPSSDGWMYDLYDLKKYQYILCSKDAGDCSYESAFEEALQQVFELIKK